MTTVCDNFKRSDIEAMVPAAVEALGGLDVLVNNAGISGPTAPVEEFNPDKWAAVMNVDLTGSFNVTRLSIALETIQGRKHHHLRCPCVETR